MEHLSPSVTDEIMLGVRGHFSLPRLLIMQYLLTEVLTPPDMLKLLKFRIRLIKLKSYLLLSSAG